MGLSFTLKMSWDEFWDGQQSNPNCELAFQYENETYILLNEKYRWLIAKYDDNNFITGDVLAECCEENYGHADYHNKDNWDDFMNKCYEVLNVPCFSGKSFKDIIEDVVFES